MQHAICEHAIVVQSVNMQHAICENAICEHAICENAICEHAICENAICEHAICEHAVLIVVVKVWYAFRVFRFFVRFSYKEGGLCLALFVFVCYFWIFCAILAFFVRFVFFWEREEGFRKNVRILCFHNFRPSQKREIFAKKRVAISASFLEQKRVFFAISMQFRHQNRQNVHFSIHSFSYTIFANLSPEKSPKMWRQICFRTRYARVRVYVHTYGAYVRASGECRSFCVFSHFWRFLSCESAIFWPWMVTLFFAQLWRNFVTIHGQKFRVS